MYRYIYTHKKIYKKIYINMYAEIFIYIYVCGIYICMPKYACIHIHKKI